MTVATAQVPTAQAAKYVQQLCKHWSHRLDVDLNGNTGVVRIPGAVTTMSALDSGLLVRVEADDTQTLGRIKGVVATHLDRFAFREAPLRFDWSESDNTLRRSRKTGSASGPAEHG